MTTTNYGEKLWDMRKKLGPVRGISYSDSESTPTAPGLARKSWKTVIGGCCWLEPLVRELGHVCCVTRQLDPGMALCYMRSYIPRDAETSDESINAVGANDIMPTCIGMHKSACLRAHPNPHASRLSSLNTLHTSRLSSCTLHSKGTPVPHFITMMPRYIQRSHHFPFRRTDVRSHPFPHGLRFLSAPPTPTPSGPGKFLRYGGKVAKYTAFTCFSAVLGLSVVIGGVFIHDVFTYSDRHVDRVPVSPLALHPERGGPKNLPVASELVGDEDEDDSLVPVKDKPRLVIVGGGWGVRPFPSHPPSCSNIGPGR